MADDQFVASFVTVRDESHGRRHGDRFGDGVRRCGREVGGGGRATSDTVGRTVGAQVPTSGIAFAPRRSRQGGECRHGVVRPAGMRSGDFFVHSYIYAVA